MDVVDDELRKLHLRWFHASEPKMSKVLRNAGIEPIRLNRIKAICDSCRECKAWERPGNTVISSYNLPTKWLEVGETDLLFYKGTEHVAFHLMDRALRFGETQKVDSKTAEELQTAYLTLWYQRHGPFQTLYSDGEMAINCEETKAFLAKLGTTLRTKAPGQHAHYIEARNGILRHTMPLCHFFFLFCSLPSFLVSPPFSL